MDEWEPGLNAAGVPIRASQDPLKASSPHPWRQYLWGLWRRHQHQPAVQPRYRRTLLLAHQMFTRGFEDQTPLK
ncbi:MAG: hypothetical protein ACREOH_22475 [Candidatus Entotheonellia bacterium]